MKQSAFIFISIIYCCSYVYAEPYVFKFGDDNGQVIYTSDGTILPFVYETSKYLPTPPGMEISYVEVQVKALSPPKVDYHRPTNKVTIVFSLTQLTLSSYSIIVKAVPIQNY